MLKRSGSEAMAVKTISYEHFAAQHGAGRSSIGDAALHRSSNTKSQQTHRRQVLAQAEKDWQIIAKRGQIQIEYDRLVATGEIRTPTAKEELIARANGHPDNESVQAARRIAERRGWAWCSS